MNICLRLWGLALLCIALTACAPLESRSDEQADDRSVERRMLVMLRAAPPHFRPDTTYTGGYDASAGRAARRRIAEGIASQYGLTIVNGWPMPALGVDCFVMEARGDASVSALVERLSGDPRVESIQAMNAFHVLAHNDPLYPLQPTARAWHLADVHKFTTGRDVRIAVIDTGAEVDHPDLVGRISITRNFVDGSPASGEVHGTAVAGIIAATADNHIGIAGVAPRSTLMSLRACWQDEGRADAVCNTFTLAKALQFALEQKAQIVNLSIGGPSDRLLTRLIDVALSRGIIIVAAADPKTRGGGFPASHRGVVAVAGLDAREDSTSMLFGPDRDIPASLPGKRWGFVSGSSFAAAHVTGLVALLRELGPHLRPHQIQDALASRDATNAAGQTRAVVDACAAVARIGGACACMCAVAGDPRMSAPP